MSESMFDLLCTRFENLTEHNVDELLELYDSLAYFKDPFNEVRDVRLIRKIFVHMFEQCIDPRFHITEKIIQGQSACARWHFHLKLKSKPEAPLVILGCTWFTFDAQGKVIEHRDYWDAAEELYEKIPMLGWLMRLLKNKLKVQ